jgi:hypothetical protein
MIKHVLLAAISMAVAAGFTNTPVAQSETMLIVPGTGYTTTNTSYPVNAIGEGFFPNADGVVVNYPASAWPLTGRHTPTATESVDAGAANLDAAIRAADGPLIIAGESQGAVVIDFEQARLVNDPTAPAADQLQFLIFADPQRGLMSFLPAATYIPVFRWTTTTPAESQYDTTIVTAEYDGWADPPDRPWDLLATANALAGAGVTHMCRTAACRATHQPAVHGATAFANPAEVPPQNITVTTNSLGATVTTMLVPTEELPLTKPLRSVLPDPVVNRIDNVLRPRIDAGYSRIDQPGDTRPYLADGHLVRPATTQGEVPTSTNASVQQRVRDRIGQLTNRHDGTMAAPRTAAATSATSAGPGSAA